MGAEEAELRLEIPGELDGRGKPGETGMIRDPGEELGIERLEERGSFLPGGGSEAVGKFLLDLVVVADSFGGTCHGGARDVGNLGGAMLWYGWIRGAEGSHGGRGGLRPRLFLMRFSKTKNGSAGKVSERGAVGKGKGIEALEPAEKDAGEVVVGKNAVKAGEKIEKVFLAIREA